MFEKAAREKFRYETVRGNVTTEDLWDMPLTPNKDRFSLDDLAKNLSRQLKEAEEESFVVKRSTAGNTLAVKLEIVKVVIAHKLAEIDAREQAAAKKLKKQQILEILAEKEDDSLRKKSTKQLEEMLNNL